MITFNGEAYELTSLDNMQTIKLYIASRMQTATHYLFFPDGVPEGDMSRMETDVTVIDLSRYILNQDTLSIDDVLSANVTEGLTLQMAINGEYVSSGSSRWNDDLDIVTDVIIPFISTNVVLLRVQEHGIAGPMLLQIGETLESIVDSDIDVGHIWEERESWKRRYDELLEHVNVEAAEFEERYRDFGQITPDINTTEFVQERLDLIVSFGTAGTSLMEILNAAVLSPQMPFISCDGKYKILMGEIPPLSWSTTLPNALILRVAAPGTHSEDDTEATSYIRFLINLAGPFHEQKLYVRANIYTFDKTYADMNFEEWLIQCIRSLLPSFALTDPVADTDRISGLFYFPEQEFNIDIFSDLILTESVFPTLLSRDDRKTVSRKKDSIYLYFNDIQSGTITARLTPKTVLDNDPLWNTYSRAQFPPGTRYIRVKIQQAQNKVGIDRYVDFMRRTMIYYNDRSVALFALYREFIGPDFGVVGSVVEPDEVEDEDKKKMLKKIVPDLFVNFYGSLCDNQPIVVSNEEAARKREQGVDIMTFPKPGAPGTPHNYECTPNRQGQPRYPGVRDNTLPNKDKYPFIPCCYLKPEQTSGYYGHYFRGEPLPVKSKTKQQNVYTSNKFGHGELPDNLLSTIKNCDTSLDAVYQRVGMNGTPSNLIVETAEAVFHTFDMQGVTTDPRFDRYSESLRTSIQSILIGYGGIRDGVDETRATDQTGKAQVDRRRLAREHAWIQSTRTELCGEEFYAVARQSIYDWSYDKYVDYMGNVDNYLDPHLFSAVVELVFGCDIYVFYNRDKVTELRLPRHTQNYLMDFPSHPKIPMVVFYNHWGSKSDRAPYPRSEIIVKGLTTQPKNRQFMFGKNRDPFGKCVVEIAKKIQESWSLNRRDIGGVNFELIEPTIARPLSQSIDPYGKCRRVDMRAIVDSLETDFSVLCRPNKPQALVLIADETPVVRVTMNVALSIVDDLRLRIVGQVVSDGEAMALTLQPVPGSQTPFRTRLTIPVHPGPPLEDVKYLEPEETGFEHRTHQSDMEQYNRNKRLARYIQDYALFLYSTHLHGAGSEPTIANLVEFIDSSTTVIPDFTYGVVPKRYSDDNGLFDDGKLVFASDEMRRRIVFYIRLFTTNNYSQLKNYYLRSNIESYYLDLSDLDQTYGYTLIDGEITLMKWIRVQMTSVYTIVKHANPKLKEPYFMIGDNINNKAPFMVQNAMTLNQAINMSALWQTSKENVGEEGASTDELDGNYAARVFMSENDGSIRLIGDYKIDADPDLTVPVLTWEQAGQIGYAAIMML